MVAVDVEYIPLGSAHIPGSNVRSIINQMTVDFWMMTESVPLDTLRKRLNVLHPTLSQDGLPLQYHFFLRNDPSGDNNGGSPDSHSDHDSSSSDNDGSGDNGWRRLH